MALYKVINAHLVLEVIGLLEKVALTREDLEATRLGLYVNNLRKKTVDQELAKRCRKLVKSWQQLVSLTPSNNASPAPGYSPAVNASRRSPASSAYLSSSPNVFSRHSSSPALPSSIKPRLASPAIARSVASTGRLVSPLVRQVGSKGSPVAAHLKRISPPNVKLTTQHSPSAVLPAPVNKSSSRPGTPNITKQPSNNVGNNFPTSTPTNHNHSNLTPNVDSTNRTHAANKKRRRSDESNTSDGASLKKARVVVNGDSTRLTERIKTPRVKTTVELIAELQAKKSTRIAASDTITKIVTNQIEKEEDDINLSIVPLSARPKFRRKNNGLADPPAAPADLSKTKSELVQRFLQQTVQLGNNGTAEDSDHGDHGEIDIMGDSSLDFPKSNTRVPNARPVIDMSVDPYSLLPPLNYDDIRWSDDENVDSQPIVRNAITGEYPEGYEHDSSNGENPDELTINKVINGEWSGVNGTVDVNSQFHTWTETFTISPNEDKTDYVHVLPYVDI